MAAAEIILRTTEPRRFTDGQHAFDYCNTANVWLRTSENPYKARIVYLMANFVNDAARTNGLFEPVLEREAASFNANGKSAAEILAGPVLCEVFGVPFAVGAGVGYRGPNRKGYVMVGLYGNFGDDFSSGNLQFGTGWKF